MYIYINKNTGKINGFSEIENVNFADCEKFEKDFFTDEEIEKLQSENFIFDFENKTIKDISKEKDIKNAKAYYIENRNLKLKHIMAGELSDGTPEAEAEIEKIRAEIVADYDARQEVMKQKAIDFKNKYGEDLYSYIIFDKNI